MKVTIHIGHEKTGTTSIQSYLARHYGRPGESLYFPQTGRRAGIEQHRILYNELLAQRPAIIKQALQRELEQAGCEHAVLSCEMFSALDPKSNAALESLIAVGSALGWKITVVCYVRKANPFLRSLYMEGLKWNWKLDFEGFVKVHLPRLLDGSLKRVIEMRGAKAVFLPYQREGMVPSFLETIAPGTGFVAEREMQLNQRIPEWMGPFILMANRTFNNQDYTHQAIVTAMQLKTSPPDWFDADAFFFLSDEIKQAIATIEATDPVRKALFSEA